MERAFKIFDRDGNGDISLAEFIDTMYQFAGKGHTEKILFLFKVYDIDGKQGILYCISIICSQANFNVAYIYKLLPKIVSILGDGMIQEEELEEVLRACLQESRV